MSAPVVLPRTLQHHIDGHKNLVLETKVPERTQVPWGTTTLSGGKPPDGPVRELVTEGRGAICRISSLVQTRGKAIELAGKVTK